MKINNTPYNTLFDRWSNKQRRIKTKAFFYRIFIYLALPFNNELAQRCEMKFRRNHRKIEILQKKTVFKEALIAPVFNMPRRAAARSGKAQKLASQWLQEICNSKGLEFKGISYSPLGICNGMSIDIASKLLHQNKSVDQVVQSLEKGGGRKAYASHILYLMTLKSYACKPTVAELIHFMKKTQKESQALLYDFTVEDVEKLLMLDELINADRVERRISELQDKMAHERDPRVQSKLELAAQVLILWKMLQNRRSFVADRQFKINGAIPPGNPAFNHWILSCFYLQYVTFHTQESAAKRGLKLTQLIETLGISSLTESNERYLENFDKLENGCYNITFISAPPLEGHAMTLIRQNGKDTLIDPNGFILRSNSGDESKKVLKEILAMYRGYNDPILGRPNHRLIIQKYEKAAL